ncbi:UNVERIFIED_CONTAM: hypothetical protein RMT77_006421 [Armadillidium vulgare]
MRMKIFNQILSFWFCLSFSLVLGKTNNEDFALGLSNNIDLEKEIESRVERNMKWFQPSSFVIEEENSDPKNLDADPKISGRLLGIHKKGASLSSAELLSTALKQALEELIHNLERFSNHFEIYVQNEAQLLALRPNPAARFAIALQAILQNSQLNLTQATLGILQAVGRVLGINITPLANALLGNTNLGGLNLVAGGLPNSGLSNTLAQLLGLRG